MPTFDDLEDLESVQGKLNNAILRTDWCVMVSDVSQLSNLTYTTGSAWTIAEGTQVITAREMFPYVAAASGATDYDLQVGSAKLNVLPTTNGEYNFRAMLPAADGTTDDYAKLNRLLGKWTLNGSSRIGPLIYIPPGIYAISTTLNLKSPARIRGDHAAFGADKLVELIFPASTAGIIVNRHNTLGDQTVTSTHGADGAEIIGLRLTGGRGSAFDETKSGIWMRARCLVSNCTCYGFAGHGIYNAAGSDGNPYLGNTNLARIYNAYVELNRGSGVHIEGTDANAGWYIGINAKNNDLWGVYEDSFLQNMHMAHHALDNDAGAYYSSNQSLLLGCYAEDGNGDNVEWAGTMIGCMITDVAASLGPKLMTEQANGPRALRNDTGGFRASTSTNSADLGSEASNILTARHTTTGISYPWRLRYKTDGVGLEMGFGSFSNPLLNINSNTTTVTYGRSSAVGESVNIPNLFLGLNTNGRCITYASTAPASGEWARGDRVFNTAPAVGSPKGWICTVGGTPGTWVSEGNL